VRWVSLRQVSVTAAPRQTSATMHKAIQASPGWRCHTCGNQAAVWHTMAHDGTRWPGTRPALLVVEAQSSLRSSAARPQLSCLRHRQRVVISAGNRAHLGPPKHILRTHQRRHLSVVGFDQAQLAVGSFAPHPQRSVLSHGHGVADALRCRRY